MPKLLFARLPQTKKQEHHIRKLAGVVKRQLIGSYAPR